MIAMVMLMTMLMGMMTMVVDNDDNLITVVMGMIAMTMDILMIV